MSDELLARQPDRTVIPLPAISVDPGVSRRCRIFAHGASILVIAIGGVCLLGWLLKSPALESIVPGSTPMKPNIAAGTLLCGVLLMLLSLGNLARPLRYFVGVMAVIAGTLGALSLAEYVSRWGVGIDHWLFRIPGGQGPPNAARTAPATALCFVFMGTALFVAARSGSTRLRVTLAAGLSAALAAIGILSMVGLLAELLFGHEWNLMGMSTSGVTAAVAFMLLGSGLLGLLHGDSGLKWSLDGRTTIGFVFGVVVMVAVAAAAFTFARHMLETNIRVTHRQEVLKQIQQTMTEMTKLGSQQRIYIIIGEEELLNGRPETQAELAQSIASLRALTSDNPRQQNQLDQLQPALAQRLAWEEKIIVARREQGFPVAQQMVSAGPGLRLSDEIASRIHSMQDEEYGLLVMDRKRAMTVSTATFLLLPLGVFLSLGILSLGVFFLNAEAGEQEKAQEALGRSEARYRELFENNPDPMWIYDLETLAFLAVNGAAIRHYGYSRDEFLALTIKDIRPPEDIAALMDDLAQGDSDQPNKRTQWRHRKKDGSVIEVEITSHEQMWLGRRAELILATDITERRRAEQLRAWLAAIVASSEDAIISKTLKGVITTWNRGAERLFGYSAAEAIGKPMLMLFPPERVAEEPEMLRRISHGETVENFETVRVAKDGKPIQVSVTLSPILNNQGEITGVSKIAHDITARKQAENEIRQLNLELEERVRRRTADLEAANKELEAFSYSVSHDLRAPLRAVDGFSQAVLEDYGAKLPDEAVHYLQTIRKGAQRMGALIDDLLSFSRLSRAPLHKQTIDTTRLVHDVVNELTVEREGRSVDLQLRELAPCHGDPALLKQVWMNLLSNALKYTRNEDKAVIEVGSQSDNGEEVYFVRDNGTGFDMRYAHKLFGVFQRLHRADEFEGTGVGLAIVQRVVHRHGGRVWAESELDRGTTFHFSLRTEPNS